MFPIIITGKVLVIKTHRNDPITTPFPYLINILLLCFTSDLYVKYVPIIDPIIMANKFTLRKIVKNDIIINVIIMNI